MSRRPTAFHGVACTALFFPDHRLSNSGSRTAGCRRCGSLDSPRSLGMTPSVIRRRPTWLMAQVGRVEPLRSDGGVDALRRVLPEPGPCTTVSCVERSVSEPARSVARHFELLLSIAWLSHSHAAQYAGETDRRLRTRSPRADGRAPARGGPALAGESWACDGEMSERGHGMLQYERLVGDRVAAKRPETRNRAADDRLTSEACQGWANAHAMA